MAENEFFAHAARDVRAVERAPVLAELRVKDRLHQDVARLFDDLAVVLAVDGVHQFVRLFHHILADALVRLGAVPRTAARRAQTAHHLAQIVKIKALFFKQRRIVHHERGCLVVFFLPVQFVQFNFFHFSVFHEKARRFVPEHIAKFQFHVARDEVAVDIVHAERQNGAYVLFKIVRRICRAVAGKYLRAAEGVRAFGNAVEHRCAAALF